jgi:hypothetical protein
MTYILYNPANPKHADAPFKKTFRRAGTSIQHLGSDIVVFGVRVKFRLNAPWLGLLYVPKRSNDWAMGQTA